MTAPPTLLRQLVAEHLAARAVTIDHLARETGLSRETLRVWYAFPDLEAPNLPAIETKIQRVVVAAMERANAV